MMTASSLSTVWCRLLQILYDAREVLQQVLSAILSYIAVLYSIATISARERPRCIYQIFKKGDRTTRCRPTDDCRSLLGSAN